MVSIHHPAEEVWSPTVLAKMIFFFFFYENARFERFTEFHWLSFYKQFHSRDCSHNDLDCTPLRWLQSAINREIPRQMYSATPETLTLMSSTISREKTELGRMNKRSFWFNGEGVFCFNALVPVPYVLSDDRSVGSILKFLRRHENRSGHAHSILQKEI